MRTLLGGDYGLISVELPNPLNADPGRYRALFGALARPLASAAMLQVPAVLLGRTISGGDLVAKKLVLSYLEQHGPTRDQTYTERARAGVAELLSVFPRTLHRHLTAEDTTFSAIRDEVRRDVAARLLATTEIWRSFESAVVSDEWETTAQN